MPPSHPVTRKAGRRHTLQPLLFFLCGLISGWAITFVVRPSSAERVLEAEPVAQMRPPSRPQPPRQPTGSGHNLRPGKRNSGEHFVKLASEQQLQLRAQLLDYTMSGTLAEFLSSLSDEQSNSLSIALENLRTRLNEHEAQNAKVTGESSERLSLSIPPLFEDSNSNSQFRDELIVLLGIELADGFLRSSAADLEGRFAFWGAGSQEFDIDIAHETASITQRVKKENKEYSYGTTYDGVSHRFEHLFEFVDLHTDAAAPNRAEQVDDAKRD